jgi:hypothetical protein
MSQGTVLVFSHSHPVLPLLLPSLGSLSRCFIINNDIQISWVPPIGSDIYRTRDLIILIYADGVAEVEDCLFPVRVLGVRTRAERDWLVGTAESNVEPA